MFRFSAALLTVVIVVGQLVQTISGNEPLKEFGEDFVGHWVGESTLPDDMPSIGKKGEKVTGHSSVRWILGRKAVEGNWRAGNLSAKWVAVWDAADKEIRVYGVTSQGDISVSRMSKNGDKWIWDTSGVSVDGKQRSAFEEMTISDNGSTHTYHITNRMEDGKKLPDFKVTWKRVSVSSIPQKALKEMEYRVGKWQSTEFIDGEKQSTPGFEVTEWTPGKHSINVRSSWVENNIPLQGSAIVGWDSEKKQLVEHWFVSDGANISFCYDIHKEKNTWIGTFKYVDSQGRIFEGSSVVKIKNNNEWTWDASWIENGATKTRRSENRRAK
ncbi:MAG: hypothetical protein JW829_04085 [Pirellulales bacterium]|nr:hypothetical protein [Pirellulales bacterium]